MTTFELGQTISAGPYLNYVSGVLADTGSLPTCTVTKPDATTAAGVCTKTATGTYLPSFAASAIAGRYRLTLSGGTSNNAGLPWSDVADVWPADPRFIISLADAKAELNNPANVTVNDDELRLYIAATTPIVENAIGAVLTRTMVETRNGGKSAVLLSERATAITSVVVDGTAITNYVADLDAGIVYGGTSRWPWTFTPGRQNVVVTYTTGSSIVDPNVILASRIIAAALYQSSQQGRAGRGRSDAADTTTVNGYAVPNRALEMLTPSVENAMPGIA